MADEEKDASPWWVGLAKKVGIAIAVAAVGAVGGNVGGGSVVDQKVATAAEVGQLRSELAAVRGDVTAVRTAVDALAVAVIQRIDGKGAVASTATGGSP